MQQQVQAAIESVSPKYTEKRTGLFQVEARYADGVVTLSGRVLEKAALDDLHRAITARVACARIDDSAVQVLRREPVVKKIVATNLTDLHAEPSFLSELLTQVLNGQPLEILQEEENWCYVRQEDGYLGWAYSSYLGVIDGDSPAPTHWIVAPALQLLAKKTVDAPIVTSLLCGTSVNADKITAKWAYVKPAGGLLQGGWVNSASLRPIENSSSPQEGKKAEPADIAEQIIADARRLTGVYYLWGGATPFGLDCSALVQLTHRINGITIPRDAYMQFKIAKPIEPPYQPGDLLYFHSDSDKHRITHVGISLGGWDMIHSSRFMNGVYEENVESAPRLRDTFAGARTFIR